ncbi:MAG TPA: tRNA pseudouridine(38-40) synthase TruA [Desulfomonilia bacterium]|nr:tRNA pseudouridine(38-40) synthase TruA [Desulfomonilia bacterium]
MRNIKCVIAYDGSGYMGWQTQAGVRTVQGVVEHAIEKVLGHPVRVVASGRTDTGVHALGQVMNFPTGTTVPVQGLLRGLNSVLPGDVAVLSAEDAAPEFHARTMARNKTYVYVLDTSPVRNPFLDRYALHVGGPLDGNAMREAAHLLTGEHDFASFQATGSGVKTTVRTITTSEVAINGDKLYVWMQGSGFLRHMVRNIVGTLLLVGQGRLEPADMHRIMALRDRRHAGPTAQPQGLYLMGVAYE